jgi:hypothetical protein
MNHDAICHTHSLPPSHLQEKPPGATWGATYIVSYLLINIHIPRQAQPILHRQKMMHSGAGQEKLHISARMQFFNCSSLSGIARKEN